MQLNLLHSVVYLQQFYLSIHPRPRGLFKPLSTSPSLTCCHFHHCWTRAGFSIIIAPSCYCISDNKQSLMSDPTHQRDYTSIKYSTVSLDCPQGISIIFITTNLSADSGYEYSYTSKTLVCKFYVDAGWLNQSNIYLL